MTGFKIMTEHKKIDNCFVDIILLVIGLGLITGAIYLEIILLFN